MFPQWIRLTRFCGVVAGIGIIAGATVPYQHGGRSLSFIFIAVIAAIPFVLPWKRIPVRTARILSILHVLPFLFAAIFGVMIILAMIHHDVSASFGAWMFLAFLFAFFMAGTTFHWFTVHQMIKIAQPASACDSQPCGFRTHER